MTGEFETPSGCKQKKPRPQGARAKIKINYKVMEKSFIHKSDLGEVVSALATRALENVETLTTKIEIRNTSWDGPKLNVEVSDAESFKTLSSTSYMIVGETIADADMYRNTIGTALEEQKKRVAYKEAQEESTSSNNE